MPQPTRSVPKCAVISIVILIALSAFALLSAMNASAAPHPTTVVGTVTDAGGRPVPDASVTVNMKDGETVMSTKSDTTDENGEYSTIFLEAEWQIGYTIQVIATFNAQQESETVTAEDEMIHTVNVQFEFEIPDFGSDIGLAVGGCAIGLVAAVMVLRKRR